MGGCAGAQPHKYQQTDILRILHNNNVTLNENKSGVFINLSYVDKQVIEELQKYIKYTIDQESTLITTEYQKTEFRAALYDSKEDKDIESITYNIEC